MEKLTHLLQIDHGMYHASQIPIISDTVFESTDHSMDGSERNEASKCQRASSMFIVINSTVDMSSFSLDCSHCNTQIGQLTTSTLTLSSCSIISNSETSPISIDAGGHTRSSSVFMLGGKHSSMSESILPLVSFAPTLAKLPADPDALPSQSSETCGDELRTLSVFGTGFDFSSKSFCVGTGPLFAFTRRNTDQTETLRWTVDLTLS
ncbi:hypothetical protein BLNAU_16320 [Blattamonas nauphoetae]|uniref:Uncharacterized protein n=1 Tax=Blattamonas nauphoetae TaxID=2049346 RepID=A0ABQ9XBS6_9EUKA|nr:hypothetical protein BLNAU_16320 [Blattamonas nauphoetae]